MEGTREAILTDVVDWACDSDNPQSFLWLHGLAGAGKSSIATSTSMRLDKRGHLGATFFCQRDKPELRDPNCVLPTIASRLAVAFPAFGKAVADELRKDPDIGTAAIPLQYESLFAAPIERLSSASAAVPSLPLVIVIDALDECGTPESRKLLLDSLLKLCRLVTWFKVVITSRPEPDIGRVLKANQSCRPFLLDIDDDANFSDILLFTKARMTEIVQSDGDLPPDWPGEARTQQLAERAGGLFIWAQTAALFISNGHDLEKCLQLILSGIPPRGAYAKLDALYATALASIYGELDDHNLEVFHVVVGSIICLSTPLAAQPLATLLEGHVSLAALQKTIRNLGSVLYLDEKNDLVIRVCHLSFIDFITDSSRCLPRFHINKLLHHPALGLASLKVLNQLKFNICGLDSSDLFNEDVPGLPAQVQLAIPIPLQYSCKNWATHLSQTPKDDSQTPTLLELVHLFFSNLLPLYWIEALSLLGEINTAITSLPLLANWLEVCDHL